MPDNTCGVIRYGFPARFKLTKTDEFSSVFNFRRRTAGEFLVVHYMPNAHGYPRLGLVVGKKQVRRARDRNYIKRALREIFRTHPERISVDIVVRVQKGFSRADFHQVEHELVSILGKLGRVCGQGVA